MKWIVRKFNEYQPKPIDKWLFIGCGILGLILLWLLVFLEG